MEEVEETAGEAKAESENESELSTDLVRDKDENDGRNNRRETDLLVKAFFLSLENEVDPVPTLSSLARRYRGRCGSIFLEVCNTSPEIDMVDREKLSTLCFERLSTGQLLALFGPLVRENPQMLTAEADDGCLLHDALCAYPPVDLPAIQLLATAEVTRRLDCVGCTPLHHACDGLHERDDSTVRFLLDLDPGQLRIENEFRELPLHGACQTRALSCEAIQRMVRSFPEAVSRTNWRGDSPLKLALYNETRWRSIATRKPWLDLCWEMIRLNPESVRPIVIGSASSLTLLAHVCRYDRRAWPAELLIEAWPVALGLADSPGASLPYDYLAPREVSSELWLLVCRATIRLFLSLMELAYHDSLRNEMAEPLRSVFQPLWPAKCVAFSARHFVNGTPRRLGSARQWDLTIEQCLRAFKHESVQALLRNSGEPSVCDVLCELYRLRTREEAAAAQEDPSSAPLSRLSAKHPVVALAAATDSLDCLFLRLRDHPRLFLPSARSDGL